MDGHNNLSEGISNYAREEERKGYAENTPLFKKIDSEEFKDLYDTRKLFLGIQRHLFLLISCMAIFGLLGGLASYKFLTTYKAEAVVLFKEEPRSSTSIEGGFTLSNLSLGT
ncbi:MAG: hypothetical protein ACE5GN_02280, partial [Waddliaceae bacterium]